MCVVDVRLISEIIQRGGSCFSSGSSSMIYVSNHQVKGDAAFPYYMSVFILFYYYNDTVQRHEQRNLR